MVPRPGPPPVSGYGAGNTHDHCRKAGKVRIFSAGLLRQGDKAAFEKFLRDHQPNIFILKGGDEVSLERMEGEYVKVRAKGSTVSFWTSRNALNHPK